MKEELELKLVEKYPTIFKDYKGDMMKTCMHWGMECPDSWYNLLNCLCYQIQNHVDWCQRNGKEITPVVAAQVKEKFGSLRFYYDGGDDFIDGVVRMAETYSAFIK